MAEREGFEPPEAFASTVFKTAAFNRSATPPGPRLARGLERDVDGEGVGFGGFEGLHPAR